MNESCFARLLKAVGSATASGSSRTRSHWQRFITARVRNRTLKKFLVQFEHSPHFLTFSRPKSTLYKDDSNVYGFRYRDKLVSIYYIYNYYMKNHIKGLYIKGFLFHVLLRQHFHWQHLGVLSNLWRKQYLRGEKNLVIIFGLIKLTTRRHILVNN